MDQKHLTVKYDFETALKKKEDARESVTGLFQVQKTELSLTIYFKPITFIYFYKPVLRIYSSYTFMPQYINFVEVNNNFQG